MSSQPFLSNKVHAFSTDVSMLGMPTRFTFPYYYSPHPLAELAMAELQKKREFADASRSSSEAGNMYAVLVVQDKSGELGYLCSVRGNAIHSSEEAANSIASHLFVDSLYQPDNALIKRRYLAEITRLKQTLATLTRDPNYQHNQQALLDNRLISEEEITQFQQGMSERKAARKAQRAQADSDTLVAFAQQSSQDKQAFKALKQAWKTRLAELEEAVESQRLAIRKTEKQLANLTHDFTIYHQKACQFINHTGQSKSLFELFSEVDKADQANITFSEENLPKLLNHAFKCSLTPVALGEFWWGASPYNEIRQHRNLYPVCQSKCFEILQHMLQGITLDDSPLEACPSLGKPLPIVYQDEDIVVVNKPAEFLSVSGKYIQDSVEQRIKDQFPHATGPLIVHRLDMSTSGLLVLTLNAQANKNLQHQFISRQVTKRYTAKLDGICTRKSGTINLPLTGDLLDRPRQMVVKKGGRTASTRFEVISTSQQHTLIHLYPITGRTHQLRVHCAHIAGLNIPIVGDDLYGFKASRLHLHAGYLKFSHPIHGKEMMFEVAADFETTT